MFGWIKCRKENKARERLLEQEREESRRKLRKEIEDLELAIEESHKRLEEGSREIDLLLEENPYQDGGYYPC